jgi:hypothetical protein
MSVAGARLLRVNAAGGMIMGTGAGDVVFTPPAAFQVRRGVRHPLGVAYELQGRSYGFRLADYDPALPVLIDPLLQSTYLGGGGDDPAFAMTTHPTTGEVYVAGYTQSPDFPGTGGGPQASYKGGDDAFVARLSPSLTTLLQATYLGGSDFDEAMALAIHPSSGQLYVAGVTYSRDFPHTAGGAQAFSRGGPGDAFVARFNAALTTLDQSTYLGGSSSDETRSLVISPASGEVYVGGYTFSSDFPLTPGGAQPASGGLPDAFVARLNASLTTLLQSTYIGGKGFDLASALAIQPTTGDVYVAGGTESLDLPGTAGGAQPASGGGHSDAFVSRLNAALTVLNQSTYLGGSDSETARSLSIHPNSGDVYAAGETYSTNFPGTAGGAQPATGGGATDAFVARLNATLTTLRQATYLGGNRNDLPLALAIHPVSGEVYIAGETDSTNFPGTVGGAQVSNGGGSDAFVARLSATLTSLSQATYVGGSFRDTGYALAIHPTTGEVYVAGQTDSTNFPGTAAGAQAVKGVGIDAFVARLSADLGALPTPTPTATAAPTSTRTPAPGPVVAVPMLSPPMLALLGLGLATLALFFTRKRL